MIDQRHRRSSRWPLAALVVLVLPAAVNPPPAVSAGASGGAIVGVVRANPLQLVLTLSAGTAKVGQAIKADVRVTNAGPATVRSISVELRADVAGVAIRNPTVRIAQLRPGKSTTVTWSICGRTIGSYLLLARAAVGGGASIDSNARLLVVTTNTRRASCP